MVAATMVAVLALRWLGKRVKMQLPDYLLALALMSLWVWFFAWDKEGVEVIGTVPQGLPSFDAPRLSWEAVRGLAGSALAIMNNACKSGHHAWCAPTSSSHHAKSRAQLNVQQLS